MLIEVFPCGPYATNAYVVGDDKLAFVIDPSKGSAKKITPFVSAKGLKIIGILLTHSHWDHIADVVPLKNLYGCPVYVHEEDRSNLAQPGIDGLPLMVAIEGVEPDRLLKEGDELPVGPFSFRVIHTPGHSGGSVCFYEPNEGVLMSGDTLFHQTIGNLSFPTSYPERMWDSLKKLEGLPKETVVFPGHGQSTTLRAESWLSDAKKLFGGL